MKSRCGWLGIWALAGVPALAGDAPADEARRLIADLDGPNAVAEHRATERLANLGDAAVPALRQAVASAGALPGRLIAVEILGRIGAPAARAALVERLAVERDLAVRGQICIQLGHLRDRSAVTALVDWLETIGPRAIHDVPGPKEVQPTTCYVRHLEALAMIGDPRAIPAIEAFRRKIPKGIGVGGFLTHFVTEAADDALEELREKQTFWTAVRRQPGLEARLAPLFEYLYTDPVARFRLHESEVIRGTAEGRATLQALTGHADPAVAGAARDLLARYDGLRR